MHAGASSAIELVAAALFAVAVVHTFATKLFAHLAAVAPAHAGLWHLLGEVEVVFGFWAMLLVLLLFGASGQRAAVDYLQGLDFTEPMFVFAIMVIAGSRPILILARDLVVLLARLAARRGAHDVLPRALGHPAARLFHHRAGGDDARRADARRVRVAAGARVAGAAVLGIRARRVVAARAGRCAAARLSWPPCTARRHCHVPRAPRRSGEGNSPARRRDWRRVRSSSRRRRPPTSRRSATGGTFTG